MAHSTPYNPVQEAFERAMREFRRGLNDETLFREILETRSVNQVYDLTDKLQAEQGQRRHLRGLSRIQPYLKRLQLYSGAIDTFVQAKPDILALIWGPIKLLIQWTSALTESLDAIVNTTAEIGLLIPEFQKSAELFHHNSLINDVLALFFQDMLDFYLVALKFFRSNRWKHFFEALWPRQKEKIEVIMQTISRHTDLLRNEVRLQDLQEARDARLAALKNMEKRDKSERHQQYYSIEARISPVFYDEKLNWLHGRTCEGTGQWLLRDPILKKWLDVKDGSTKVLWLQGIPGAGKTFLAGTIIDAAMDTGMGRTIYAFLSHILRNNTSALTILHSLIFQLARYDHDLQDIVSEKWEESREKLHTDIKIVAKLLRALVMCVEPVYIIIDGVDEIDEKERVILLEHLLALVQDCEGTRAIFNSRPEDDISEVLEPVSTEIRVDTRNAGSIQAFVTRQSRGWLQRNSFDPVTSAEIQGLLAPLAFQAKGMFLYAKIVLSSIELLNDVDEVRNELKVLPESLDDAYRRIFSRINSLHPTTKDKARKILGWIGCSPVPLTLRELEQALGIRQGDFDSDRPVPSPLNIVQLCGPIVEEADGYVQFVHFTVKEYIFSPKIQESLDLTSATLSLAMCCITYLCQSHHEPDIEEEDLVENLVRGKYRLHYYSVEMWLRLVEQYMASLSFKSDNAPIPAALVDLLDEFLDSRRNFEFTPRPVGSQRHAFAPFKDSHPSIHEMLCNEARFHQSSLSLQYDLHKGKPTAPVLRTACEDVLSLTIAFYEDDWVKLDPLSIRFMSRSLYNAFDTLLCPGNPHLDACNCRSIYFHYGELPFKCGFLSCELSRHGFKSKLTRTSHTKYHDRPWKCDVPSCEYLEIGFLSRRMRNDHLDNYHRDSVKPTIPLDTNMNANEAQPILFALVKADKVDAVLRLRPFFQKLKGSVQRKLKEIAAYSGSIQMLNILCTSDQGVVNIGSPSYWAELLHSAVDGQNIETLEWLASRFPFSEPYSLGRADISVLLSKFLKSDFLQASQIVEDMVVNRYTISVFVHNSYLFLTRVIAPTAGDTERERILASIWKRVADNGSIAKTVFGTGLASVADTTCSIFLARTLLDMGADVNYRHQRFRTPLHRAAQKDTAQAAKLMKFLLENGADPEVECRTFGDQRRVSGRPTGSGSSLEKGEVIKLKDEKGATGISKWLGISWDELVEDSKRTRNNNEKSEVD